MLPDAGQLLLPTSLLTAALGVRLFIAAVFVFAAQHKLRNRLRFQGIVRQYKLTPASASAALSLAIPLCEFGIAVALLVLPLIGALMAAALLGLYAGGIAINLVRGRQHIDCGCGGEATPLSTALIGRNLLMVFMVLLVLFVETSEFTTVLAELSVFSAVLGCAFAAGLGAIYVCFNQLQVNAGIHQRLWLEAQTD